MDLLVFKDLRHRGDVRKAVRYLSLEIRGVVWSRERHLRETGIKRIFKTMGMNRTLRKYRKQRSRDRVLAYSSTRGYREKSLDRT